MSTTRRRLAVAGLAALAALAWATGVAADEIKAPTPFEPWKIPYRVRDALADRVEKAWGRVERPLRDAAVGRASHAAAAPGPSTTPVRWWSIPRAGRDAARRYAALQHKSVTRVVRVQEADGSAHFQVYAAGRDGWKRTPEEMLISVDDPKSGVNRAADVPVAPAPVNREGR
jgi:hypothetical protein